MSGAGGTLQVRDINTGRDAVVVLGTFVQASTGQRLPLHLPVRADHFTDRQTELSSLLAELQPGRVVTLAGPGGMGKTALAAEAVGHLVVGNKPPERFPDGVFFHSFYIQPQASLALESLVTAFGEQPRPTLQAAAQRALSGRQALLVLDGAEDADNLAAVLAVRGQCGVLVTSRDRDDALAALQNLAPLAQADAVQLLQAWAEAPLDDLAAAETICQLLGRLPLAIRLVGRYLRSKQETASEYLVWLQKTPLEALDQGQRRQESVPVLLARSLAQVSAEARQVLGLAGLLALAPFRREMVAAVLAAEAGEVRRWLGELVTYSLLTRTKGAYAVTHAIIHTYARHQLPVDDDTAGRLVAVYTALAKAASKKGLPGYRILDPERPHLLRLIAACVERGHWAGAKDLVWAVDGYLDIQGHAVQRQQALQAGLAAAQKLADRRDEEAFLIKLGLSARALGQVTQAIAYYRQALPICREIGHRQDEGATLGNLGLAYRDLGQVEQAIDHHQQALAINREIGYRQGEAADLDALGIAYHVLGEVEQAIDHHQQALAINREIGYRQGEAIDLNNLGLAYRDLGQVDQAIDHYQQALAIYREIGYRRGEASALGNLGLAYSDLGQVDQAIDHYRQALAIDREIGYRQGEASQLGNLGNAYRDLGQVEQAIDHHRQALAIDREIGYRQGEAADLNNLGIAYRDLGQIDQARDHLTQALHIYEAIKSPAADRVRRRLADLDEHAPTQDE